MDLEQAMDANMAIALGFVDGMIEDGKKPDNQPESPIVTNKTTVKSCIARLNLITGGKMYV